MYRIIDHQGKLWITGAVVVHDKSTHLASIEALHAEFSNGVFVVLADVLAEDAYKKAREINAVRHLPMIQIQLEHEENAGHEPASFEGFLKDAGYEKVPDEEMAVADLEAGSVKFKRAEDTELDLFQFIEKATEECGAMVIIVGDDEGIVDDLIETVCEEMIE